MADAGPDQTVDLGVTVQLDGGHSHDIDEDSLTYHWSFTARPEGSLAQLSDPTAQQPTFVADLEGPYVVQLIVNVVRKTAPRTRSTSPRRGRRGLKSVTAANNHPPVIASTPSVAL